MCFFLFYFFKDDEISPLEEALTTQVVHQLKDKGHSSTNSLGENICSSFVNRQILLRRRKESNGIVRAQICKLA